MPSSLGVRWIPFLSTALFCASAHAAEAGAPLPDPFAFNDGSRVETPSDWERRRAEMIAQLEELHYGHAPPVPSEIAVHELQQEEHTFGEGSIRALLTTAVLEFDGIRMRVGYWRPLEHDEPVPVLLACEPVWWPNPFRDHGIAERIVRRGYAFAGFWIDDLASFEDPGQRPAQDAHPEYDWGTVAVAAWGYRVTMNWLESIPGLDASRVGIWGHSRRGKACAWAGAQDERFAVVIPHMSGMGGTAAYRVRSPGAQRIEQLLERYWLHPTVFEHIGREDALPFDQHWLHALVAPRAMYIHVGLGDAWGNPMGEQAAWQAGREVYRWLGAPEKLGIYFGAYDHHDPGQPDGSDSWETALDFLDAQFRAGTPVKEFNKAHFPLEPIPFRWRSP